MEEKSSRGGKRIGAGRKPVDNPKKQFTFYFKKRDVWKFGSEEKMKYQINNFVDKYGSYNETSVPEVAPIIPLQDSASDLTGIPFTTIGKKIKIRRSVQSWLDWKRDIQDEEEYDKFKEEINDADYLTQKEKKYIFNN